MIWTTAYLMIALLVAGFEFSSRHDKTALSALESVAIGCFWIVRFGMYAWFSLIRYPAKE